MPDPRDLLSDMQGREDDAPSIADSQAVRRSQRDRRSIRDLRQQLRATEQELEAERAAREVLLAWQDEPPEIHRIEAPKGSRRRIVTFSCLSDLHVEERVDPRTVNGLNSFDLREADRRLEQAFVSTTKLVAKEQAAADIRTHVVWFGGDGYSGHIHEDLIEIAAMTPMESVLWLRARYLAGLKYLCENLDVDEVVAIFQYGNHGRDGKKPRVATAAEHNYEWMLGQMLVEDLKHAPWADKVRTIAERGYHTYLDVGGFVVRFHHGEGIRYAGGVGGLSIPLNKAIAKWNESIRADLDVLGHWHQQMDLPNAVMNGSLIGYNAYAVKIKAEYEPPKQAFFNVDLDRRAKTGFFDVFVMPPPKRSRRRRRSKNLVS